MKILGKIPFYVISSARFGGALARLGQCLGMPSGGGAGLAGARSRCALWWKMGYDFMSYYSWHQAGYQGYVTIIRTIHDDHEHI